MIVSGGLVVYSNTGLLRTQNSRRNHERLPFAVAAAGFIAQRDLQTAANVSSRSLRQAPNTRAVSLGSGTSGRMHGKLCRFETMIRISRNRATTTRHIICDEPLQPCLGALPFRETMP